VHIETADPAGRERLFRCCARPPFALGRLHEPIPNSCFMRLPSSAGGNGMLLLTPLELLDRRRYVGVLA
jgi:hypothetical protein